jgi:phosphoglycerate dehydrogenase-like enzyme
MAIKVVVVDRAKLPEGVEFPPLQASKYGWEEYPSLDCEALAERCWKADVLVSLGTPIRRELMEKLHRLKFVITAGNAIEELDEAAARERSVELLAFPDASYGDPGEARDLCERITMAIDHYIRSFER